MKVSAFVDSWTAQSQFDVNCIYRLPNYSKNHAPSSSYQLGLNRSLYLIGGRASIGAYCRDNPFTIQAGSGNCLVISMVRGVPGLSDKERKALGLKKEALMGKAMGVFKAKTLTVVQIQPGTPTNDQIAMPKNSSVCIPDMIAFLEATLMDSITEFMGIDTGGVSSAKSQRYEHNQKYGRGQYS